MQRLQQLDEIEQAVWVELDRAPRDRDHAWRVGVLATTDGQSAQARSVVLRDVDKARRKLLFYADSRSPKVQQLQAHPAGALVLWSPALSWQLRLKVQLGVESAGLAVSSRWAALKMSPGAQDYLSPLPPGSPIGAPLPERGSREFFSVITAHIESPDWLELPPEGPRRAVFDDQGRRWVTP